MTRTIRLWAAGWLLSLVGRGHEGRPLFGTDEARRFFLDRLAKVFTAEAVDLLAWALLVNHYHLLIRVTNLAPETLFRRLNTSLGMRERLRCGDRGAVFQGRYWSRPVAGEGAVLSVVTYVLGNPIHHGLVPTAQALERYPWTAYPEVLGLGGPGLVDPRRTLALLHPDEATARSLLREAMEARALGWQSQRAGIDVCEEPGCRGTRDGCFLLHPERRRVTPANAAAATPALADEIARVAAVHDERTDRCARLRLAGWTAAHLLDPVCSRLEADAGSVRAGRRTAPEAAARSLIAHVACDGAAVSAEAVADLVGVTGAAISAARRRGAVLLTSRGWTVDEVLAWCEPARRLDRESRAGAGSGKLIS